MNKHKKAFYSRDPKAYPLMKVLEPRIMFDGAAIFSGLDALDSLEAQKNNLDQTDISQQSLDNNQSLFSENVSTSKDFVFIDKGVNDYESLVHSIGSSKQIFIIDSNKDGFIEIQNILQGKSNLDSVHLIGHGSAGQIIFGNTTLSSENLNQYTDALRVIGSALTTSGDILFYGCNIAQTETGELLIQQIGNITQADIAASTDLTGKNGDWDLEHKIGSIESESLVFEEFNGTLDSYGVDSINSNVVAIHSATNFKATWSSGSGNNGGQTDPSSDRFIITMERQNITNSGGTLVFDQAGTNSTYTASSTNKINSYLIYANDNTRGGPSRRTASRAGSVTFDNDILGYYTAWTSTIDNNYLDKSGATYPSTSASKVSKRAFEDFRTYQNTSTDWAYLTGNKTITFGSWNGYKGDFIRVITKATPTNTAPVASYDYAVINEDASFSVSDGAGENVVGNYDSSGENTGDILDSDNSSYDDTDADGDSLTITSVRIGRVENSGTAGTLGQALTGTYGQLTLNANGSYSYSANQNAADTLDSGDSVYDYFNYTVSDGTDTDSAVIRIQVKGINDDITAVNDFDAVNEDATITRSASSSYSVDYDDTDADGDDNYTNFTITAIKTGSTEGSGTAGTVGSALTGTYGTLTLNADGSYSYVADQSAADDLDSGDTAYDYFNYTVSDGTDTDIAVLRITVTGTNDAPVAQNDVGVINEDATLTVSNSANANVSGSYDATGEHSGDVINTSSSSHNDSDPDDSASLVVSAIRTGGTEGSGTAGSIGSALTGTYGQLTIAANGSYSYVANQSAADDLDAGDSATDVFNYTLSDGTATDIGTITITVLGLNDPVVAANDTGSVNEDATLTVSDGSGDIIANNDTDADDSASLVVSAIRTGGVEGGGTAGTVGSALTGTYGQLTLNANGSYTYVANQAAADALDANDTATDVFNYTLSDGTATDTATITITVTGINDPVVATNDTGAVNEDATLTVSDGSGDIIANNDTDADDSASLVVSAIRTGGTEGSGTAGTLGQALTGTYGQLTLNANGSYTYVANQAAADALDANDTATDVFNYTLSDGTATDTATITITVTGINDPVVAANDTGSVNEDATLTVSDGSGDIIANNDTDADDSASLVVSAIRTGGTEGSGTAGTVGSALTGTYGTLTLNANGSYSYVADQAAADDLDAGDTATDVFNYTLSDGTATDIATITITVTGINDPVVATNDTGSVNEDATLTVSDGSGDIIANNDTDADDGASLSVSSFRVGSTEGSGTAGTLGQALTGTYGQLTLNANGSYTYVANQAAADALDANDTATDVFNYTVSDGTSSDTATITITVTGINDPVVATNDTGSVNEDATLTVSDGSGDIIANNDTDADDSASLVVSAIRIGGTEGSGTAGTVGSALTGTYGQLTLNANGSYTYVANQAAADDLDAGDTATDVFNYTLSDGTATDIATITITVTGINDAPVAQNDVGVINEDATLTVSNSANANVSGSYDATGEHSGDVINTSSSSHNDSDPDDSASLVVSAIRLGSSEGSGTAGTLGSALTGTYGTLTMNANGSYTYVADQAAADNLNAGQSATDSFNYTLSDGTATDIGVIQITVLGLNNDSSNAAPSATNDTDEVNANETITRSDGSSQDVQRDDTDSDGDTLTVSAIRTGAESGSGTSGSVGSALTGTYGTITLNANGSYSYVADQDAADSISDGATATDTFTYTITDGDKTDTAEIVITVTGTNFVAVNDTDSVNEDATVTATDGSSTDVITDDSGSGTLVVSAIRLGGTEGSGTAGTVGSALTGTYGTLTLNADGSYSYVADQSAADALDANDTATDVFNYTLSNGSSTDTATLTITVTGINDLVVATNDTGSVNEDATLTVSDGSGDIIANNDTDADDSASLVVSAIRTGGTEGSGTAGTVGQALTGTYGTLTLNANGSYSYVADQSAADALDANDTATDVFNYTLSDGITTDIATITITVTGINDPVVAANDTGSVNEDATLTVSDGSGDIIANNDTDADDSASLVVSAIRTGGVEGGGTAGTVGSALTGTYGTLTLNANGSYTYVANQAAADALDANDTATDVFNYTLSDGTATDTATITITVTGINDPVVATNDTGAVNEDATLTVSDGSGDIIANNDTDADDSASLVVSAIRTGGTEGSGTAGTVGSALTGTYGQLTLNANGSYTYVANQAAADALDANDTATDVFNYTLSDGTATDTATITITVTGIDDDITAVNDTDEVDEDGTISRAAGSAYDIDSDDTDLDDSSSSSITAIRIGGVEGGGTAGTVGQALTGTYGTLTLNADGSYTYVADQAAADALDAGDTVTDSFNYTVTSGSQTDTATLVFTVTGINDPVVAANDTGSVNEDATLTVSDGSGDIIANNDTDADDSASLVVSAIRTGGTEGSGTAGTVGSALTGTYGTLTLNANGSYTYVADQAAADALDANDTATDVFNYTLSDGTTTDTATITITVTGIDDDITAVNDTDAVDEDGTISRAAGSAYDVDSDDTDLDDSSSSSITAIRIGASEGNGVSGTVGSALTGTYGTLTLNADGSYTYVADQAAADALDAGDTVTDSFNYTVTSGSQTDTATLVFTVTGINDPVVAVNDTDAVTEDATISRSVGDDQELDGDDTDSDASSSSTITNIRTGATEGSGTEGTIGSGLVGTYGTLTVNADGSYTYVADQQASDELGAGVSATDSFNYTVSDGTSTDTATLVITVTGTDPKNNPIAADDTGSVIEGNTLTVSDGDSDLIAANDTDADTATSSLTISGIRTGSESGTGTTGTVGTALVGTYGTLTVNANGSYTYVANTDAAKEIAPGRSEVDKFTYTLTDGVDTDTAQISFTVTGINNPPTVTPMGDVSVLETQKITLDTTTFFNDPDPSDNGYGQLLYSTTGLPSQLSIDEDTGLIIGTFGVDEYGTYTFTITGTDGGNLSTQTTVTIHVRKPIPEIDDNVKVNKKTGEFKKVKIKAKNIEKLNLRAEARVQNFSSNYSVPEIVRDLSFSGGLKVVDVGAEVMNTKLVPNQEGVTVGFSIADDYKQNVKQYTGVMKDGSALPDWIKVDPNNGQTLTQFPEGIEAIEIKIIAIEKDNTARNINVVLDKAKIEADPFLQKDLDKFFDRSATLKTLVEVDNQGQVNLQRQTDNEIDQTLTSNLNTPLNDSMRTPDVFFQEGFKPQATFKISNMENTTTGYKIDIIDDSRDTVKQYSASFANGTPLPQWISINPISGLIEANPPSGIEKISFKVLAEDDDGDTRVLDVELDFTSNDELSSLIPQDQESIQSISPLSDQLFSEYNKYENYGSKLIDRINA